MRSALAAIAVLLAACGADPMGDPLRDRQWSLDLLVPGADLPNRGEGVTVAVIDSGVMTDHPDLAGRVDEGIDLVDPGTPPDDAYGHGTHVAGIIAAEPDNGIAMAGLAPGVTILPVRVLDAAGEGEYDRTAEGIRWAVDHGAHVLNLSVTLAEDDRRVREAVEYARRHNVVMVAAAGNRRCPDEGVNETVYPAAYAGVIGVGATGETDRPARFSSCGPWVDVAAPGVGILSITSPEARADECRDTDGWCILTGTSEAAPFVTAAVALRIAQLGVDRYIADEVIADVIASAHHGRLDPVALLD